MNPRRSPSLLVTFGLLSLVPIVLLGIMLAHSLRDSLIGREIASTARTTQFVANVAMPAYLSKADIKNGLSPFQRLALDAGIRSQAVGNDVSGVEIRSASGRIVYLAPGVTPLSEQDFREVLRGETISRVAHEKQGKVVFVAVPLRFMPDPEPVGVVRLFVPYEVIAQHTAKDLHRMYLILLGGLALLWAVLFPIVARASTQLRRQAVTMEHLAHHDELTGLPNRKRFHERVEEALREGEAAVMVLDLDGFKEVNDTHGHAGGDELLEIVAERLHRLVRGDDLVARLGGDEFGILLPAPGASGAAHAIADRIGAVLAEPLAIRGRRVTVRASVGVAFAATNGTDVEELLHDADLAMYQAKDDGGGYRFAAAA